MTDSDRTDPLPDSGEAGNFVEPVDLGGDPDVVVEGTDPAVDKGDFTTSTDFGDGQTTPPNVTREDGDYTTSQSHDNDAVDDGEYTDRNVAPR